jgi:hypothetical protein
VRKEKLVGFCRVGIAHHHGMSKGCILSGNARPTLLLTTKTEGSKAIIVFALFASYALFEDKF